MRILPRRRADHGAWTLRRCEEMPMTPTRAGDPGFRRRFGGQGAVMRRSPMTTKRPRKPGPFRVCAGYPAKPHPCAGESADRGSPNRAANYAAAPRRGTPEVAGCAAECKYRIVMRPARAVVIRHRIVAGISLRQGANAPAGEKLRAQEPGGDIARAIRVRDAGEQHLSGIRRSHPARPFGAVKRQRIGPDLGTPEGFLETGGEAVRLRF